MEKIQIQEPSLTNKDQQLSLNGISSNNKVITEMSNLIKMTNIDLLPKKKALMAWRRGNAK